MIADFADFEHIRAPQVESLESQGHEQESGPQAALSQAGEESAQCT